MTDSGNTNQTLQFIATVIVPIIATIIVGLIGVSLPYIMLFGIIFQLLGMGLLWTQLPKSSELNWQYATALSVYIAVFLVLCFGLFESLNEEDSKPEKETVIITATPEAEITRQLIADFDTPETSFDSKRIIRDGVDKADCTAEIVDDALRFENVPNDVLQGCRLAVRPQERPFFGNLGSLFIDVTVLDAPEIQESSVEEELITYFGDGEYLIISCGIWSVDEELTGFLKIYVSGSPDTLVCGTRSQDQDASDGLCEMYSESFNPINQGTAYTVELHANRESTNEFQCFVGNERRQYWIDIAATGLASDLSTAKFERYINAWYSPQSSVSYQIDNIYEER